MPNMLLEKSRKIAAEGMKMLSQTKTTPRCGYDADGSKVRCYKEQYCIGTWNVRSMNEGKLKLGQTGDGKSEHRHFRNQ